MNSLDEEKTAQSLASPGGETHRLAGWIGPGCCGGLRPFLRGAQACVGPLPQILHRRGRTRGWLVLAIALSLGLGWILLRPSLETNGDEALRPEEQPAEIRQGLRGPTESRPERVDSVQADGGTSSGHLPVFNGRGSIRGLLTTRDGRPVPLPYVLHVGPSNSLTGRERAESRSQAFDMLEFEFKDLPLGGYDVWVSAEKMNSARTPVLLTASSQHPYLVLKISPTGFVDGFVINEDGRPAQELPVELRAMNGDLRLVTKTRPDGFYLLDDVADGEYRIRFGPAHQPLVPEREISFQAPSMRFPKVTLPPTVDLIIHMTDRAGKDAPAVTLSGFGKPTGRLSALTDDQGVARIYNLPPGRYQVNAENAEGLGARITLEVTDAPNQEHYFAIR